MSVIVCVFILMFTFRVSGGSRISPRRGRQLPGGRQHTILPNFPKNCMKLKEFGPSGGRVSLDPPLKVFVILIFLPIVTLVETWKMFGQFVKKQKDT